MKNRKIKLMLVIILIGIICTNIYALEFLVNDYTPDHQRSPRVALNGFGNFVITWHGGGNDNQNYTSGVYARRFTSDGTKTGTEITVNAPTSYNRWFPSIGMSSSDYMVITWYTSGNYTLGEKSGIYAQRLDSGAGKIGTEFPVNSYLDGDQFYPAVAMDGSGNFVVAWYGYGDESLGNLDMSDIFAQKFSSDGSKVGGEIIVNTYTKGSQDFPDVAMDGSGNFVVTWYGNGKPELGDTTGYGVYAQKYSSSSTKIGEEFLVNTYTSGDQSRPRIAMNSSGNFVITWMSYEQDGSMYGVYAQKFDGNSKKVGNEIQVNTYTDGSQSYPSAAIDASGNFIVVWEGSGDPALGAFSGIYAQKFNSDTSRNGIVFMANEDKYKSKSSPDVAMDPDGNAVITWSSTFQVSYDAGDDIYAAIFLASTEPKVDIYSNQDTYTVGDTMNIMASVNNPESKNLDFYAAILLGNTLLFYPTWDKTPHATTVDIVKWYQTIAQIPVVPIIPKGNYTFLAAITESGTLNIADSDVVTITIK